MEGEEHSISFKCMYMKEKTKAKRKIKELKQSNGRIHNIIGLTKQNFQHII